MLVRVFDSQTNIYFKTEVYAIVNGGWYEKQLVVFFIGNDSYFKLFDYLDKSNPSNAKVLINSIFDCGFYSEFECTYQKSGGVDECIEDYKGLLKNDVRFFEYRGYSWIYDNRKLLSRLLNGEIVSTKEFESRLIEANAYKKEGWNYVSTKEDIDFILEQTYSFHDSVLKSLDYVSGSFVGEDNAMRCFDSEKTVTMYFDSQWCDSLELVFEGVTVLNLRPSLDNYGSNIYQITLQIVDEQVYFYDGFVSNITDDYEGTWTKSYCLRWRFI